MIRNNEPDPRTEDSLRQRLHRLADHAPASVPSVGAVPIRTSTAPLQPSRRRRRAAGIGATIAVIATGLGLTTLAVQSGGEGGADSPEDAVRALVTAVAQEDVIGALDVIVPEEGAPLRRAIETTTSEAARVGLLDPSVDLGGLGGLDLNLTDLQLDTEILEDGLAVVLVTSGLISADFDPTTFPFGPVAVDAFGGELRDGRTVLEIGDGVGSPMVATVERDGRWYVSPTFTAAEYARRSAGLEFPAPSAASPTGADSPHEAVSALYDRLLAFDLPGALDMVAGGDGAALVRYSPLWLPRATEALERAAADGSSVRISGLELAEEGSGDRRVLRPTAYVLEGTMPPVVREWYGDPDAPTLVSTADGRFAVIPAGQPAPATIDELEVLDDFPEELYGVPFNSATAYPDGTIDAPLIGEPGGTEPDPFRITLADGCTAFVGPSFARSSEDESPQFDPSTGAGFTWIEGGYRLCGSFDGVTTLFSLPLVWGWGSGYFELPPIEVTEEGGRWYVSPLGTLGNVVSGSLASIPDDAPLLDTWLGPYLLMGYSRMAFEFSLVGTTTDQIPAECLPVVVVDGGATTALRDDAPLAALRSCAVALSTFDSWSEETWSEDGSWSEDGTWSEDVGPVTEATAPGDVPPVPTTTAELEP
jgi:hypothetical protein